MVESQESMQESAAEANASATDEEVGSAVERNIILWLTNVSHGVNHFQNQMMVVLYPVIMPELGFGYAELGVLLGRPKYAWRRHSRLLRVRHALSTTDLDTGHRQPRPGVRYFGHGLRQLLWRYHKHPLRGLRRRQRPAPSTQ